MKKRIVIIFSVFFLCASMHVDSLSWAWSLSDLLSKKDSPKETKKPNKTIVVLLDKTASIKDQTTVFKSAINTVFKELKPGDRFRLAEITGDSASDFDFNVSLNIPNKPKYSMLTSNSSEYTEKLNIFNKKVSEQKEKAKEKTYKELDKKPTAMTTDLFGAIYTANLYLKKEKNRKILLILSDMIEEDQNWRFNKIHWNNAIEKKILNKQKTLSLIPNMDGACVIVVGAKASSLSREQWIRKFWGDFFKDSNATFDDSMYSHTLLTWPEDASCGKK